MSECGWPTGAPTAGHFDGKHGKVSDLGKKFLSKPGSKGYWIYLGHYWQSFMDRREPDYKARFVYYD